MEPPVKVSGVHAQLPLFSACPPRPQTRGRLVWPAWRWGATCGYKQGLGLFAAVWKGEGAGGRDGEAWGQPGLICPHPP